MMMRLALVTLVTASLCVACDSTPPDPLQVSVAASPAAIKIGDTVSVNVTIVNSGSASKQISYGACDYHFDVLQEETSVLGAYSGPCILILLVKTIEPGDTVVLPSRWLGEQWVAGQRTSAPPGIYSIVGQHPVTGRPAGNLVSVEILPP